MSNRTKYQAAVLLLFACLFSQGGQAQSSSTPDFAAIPDILNGQRTMLSVHDLFVYAWDPVKLQTQSTQLFTANGKVSQQMVSVTPAHTANPLYISAHMIADHDLLFQWSDNLYVSDAKTPLNSTALSSPPEGKPRILLASDLDGDGLQEGIAISDTAITVVKYLPSGTGSCTGQTACLTLLKSFSLESTLARTPFTAATMGDFDGDGHPEIAILSGKTLRILKVDPKTYTITSTSSDLAIVVVPNARAAASSAIRGASLSILAAACLLGFSQRRRQGLPFLCGLLVCISCQMLVGCGVATSPKVTVGDSGNNGGEALSITAGHFTTTQSEQLVIVQGPVTATDGSVLYGVNFDTKLHATLAFSAQTNNDGPYDGDIEVATANFDNSGFNQVVLKQNPAGGPTNRRIQAVSFDSKFTPKFAPNVDLNSINTCQSASIAVGNFDQTTAAAGGAPTSQVAIYVYGCQAPYNQQVVVYNVDPMTYTFTQAQTFQAPDQPTNGSGYAIRPTLLVADLQGRSLILGTPQVTTLLEHIQPVAIIGMPPMHVDCDDEEFKPAQGAQPCSVPLNVSAVPSSFQTSYTSGSSADVIFQHHDSTSWSNGFTEKVGFSSRLGAKANNITVSGKLALQQQWGNSVEHDYGSTSTTSQSLSVATGSGDEVIYRSSRVTFYLYPVLGPPVCPAGNSNCSDSEKQQRTIIFSGVDHTNVANVESTRLLWYQPPWEPFNVLSYPGNLTQLKLWNADLNVLSSPNRYGTDDNSLSTTTQWANAGNNGKTLGSTQQYNVKATASVSFTASPDLSQNTGSLSLSYQHSFALATLDTNSVSLSSSTGVTTTKKPILGGYNYGYSVSPLIAGEMANPLTDQSQLTASSDLNIFGTLQSLNTVGLDDSLAGDWWVTHYAKAPDLALNHPLRWVLQTPQVPSAGNDQPVNCLAIGAAGTTGTDCIIQAVQNPRYKISNPDDLLQYYPLSMRGLFISTSAGSAPGDSADVPQLMAGREGEPLSLKVRVSNYSFTPTPTGATIHARVYARVVAPGTREATGSDILLGEGTSQTPIPGYSSTATTATNWQLISLPDVNVDKYVGKILTFWVIVWAEQNGQPVGELAHHGLNSLPGADLTFAQALKMSEYNGNNLGIYDVQFPILSSTDAPSGEVSATATQTPMVASLTNEVTAADTSGVSGRLRLTLGPPVDLPMVKVLYYDTPPSSSAVAFAEQDIPSLQQGVLTGVRQFYTKCGAHTIYAVIAPGQTYTQTVSTALPDPCKP